MGITPITNLLPLPSARPGGADLEPRPMERAESTARISDETYSPSDEKFAPGADDDAPEENASAEEFEDSATEDQSEIPKAPVDDGSAHQINLFA